MTENLLKMRTSGTIQDDYATEKDKKKAYQIFFFSAISSVVVTTALYYISILY